MSNRVFVCAAVAAAVAGTSYAQSVRTVTTPSGTFLVKGDDFKAPRLPHGQAEGTLLWSFLDPVAICESVSISPAGNSGWAGMHLNAERLQRYEIAGDGLPTFESPAGSLSPSVVSAARTADLAVFLDRPDLPAPGTFFQLRAYNSAGVELWTRNLPQQYQFVGPHMLKVSRDGSTVAVAFNANPSGNILYFLNGATGDTVQTWSGETGTIGSVDLTSDGSLAFILHAHPNATGRLISRATGLEEFSAPGSGVGARYQISGDGNVLAIGGFSFHVYRKVGATYTLGINFTTSGHWFGAASAISADGSTVGTLAHNYSNGYQTSQTRIWDVATGGLLGLFQTSGSGTVQGSAVGAAFSDDGQTFAAAHWGTIENSHTKVLVLNRSAELIGGFDTPGSPFFVDLSPDGKYVMVGAKAVHANTTGNGGGVYMYDTGVGGQPCYANCDQSTSPPILNVADFTCFLTKFAAGDAYANCDGSTAPPVLNVADFTCFLTKFAAGCP
jgi:hypothetical protein